MIGSDNECAPWTSDCPLVENAALSDLLQSEAEVSRQIARTITVFRSSGADPVCLKEFDAYIGDILRRFKRRQVTDVFQDRKPRLREYS